jgi:hypothetical protein
VSEFVDPIKKPSSPIPNRKVGRPLRFTTPEEFQVVLQEYFDITPEEEITVTGMILHCGLSKQLLSNYANMSEYAKIVADARAICENAYERDLRRHGRSGDIFALKNFGWKDQSEIAVSGAAITMNILKNSDEKTKDVDDGKAVEKTDGSV